MRVRPYYDHIPLHRLWAFTTPQGDLTSTEEIHVLECEECCASFLACVRARNFGETLKQLEEQDDVPLAQAS